MGRETKSNGQKDTFDRFYTTPATVEKCLSLIDFTKYDYIIENNGTVDELKEKAKGFLKNL